MSDRDPSRHGAAGMPKPRTHSFNTSRICWFGRDCNRGDCYFVHPWRDEGSVPREPRDYGYGRNIAPRGSSSYRPQGPLKSLNTNLGAVSGPKTASSIPTEWGAISRSPKNDGVKDRHRENPAVRSQTLTSHDAARASIPQEDKPTNASRKTDEDDVAAAVAVVDSMDVDLPTVDRQGLQTSHEKATQANGSASEMVVMTTEDVQQPTDTDTDTDKQTNIFEEVDRTKSHLPTQRLLEQNITSETSPPAGNLESSEDLDTEAMSLGEILSAIIKIRILIHEVDVRRRHSKNNLLSYERIIENEQYPGKGSMWLELRDAEKAKLQQIQNEHDELYRQLKELLAKLRILTLAISQRPASMTNQEHDTETLRKENELLREKLGNHDKSIQALQEQLQEILSSRFITRDEGHRAAEPLIFRLDRLEGTVTKTLNSRLEEEADYNKAALDQLDTNITVQQELRGLKAETSNTSMQMATLASQQTETSLLSQNNNANLQNIKVKLHDTDTQLQNNFKEFVEFTAAILKRIEELEKLSPRENSLDIGSENLNAAEIESDLARPSRLITSFEHWQKTSALELQLISLRERFDGFTMDHHINHIVQIMQQIWHPQSGALAQRLNALEHNSNDLDQATRQKIDGLELVVSAKAEGKDLTQLLETLSKAMSAATADRQLVEKLSKTFIDEQAKHEKTRQELDTVNISVARIEALQSNDKNELKKFADDFSKATEQQTQSNARKDKNIKDNTQSLATLLGRVDQLEQRAKPRSDAKPRNDVRSQSDTISANSEETPRSAPSPNVSRGLGSSMLQTPKHTLKRKFTGSGEQRYRDGRRL